MLHYLCTLGHNGALHYSTPPYTTLCYTGLHYTAISDRGTTTLHYTRPDDTTPHYTILHYSPHTTLHVCTIMRYDGACWYLAYGTACGVVLCSAVQRSAVHTTLHYTINCQFSWWSSVVQYSSVVQCSVAQCSVLSLMVLVSRCVV